MVEAAFVLTCTAEVRQAPGLTSTLLRTVQQGSRVKQAGRSITIDGVERIPVLPRGWLNRDVLEPVSDTPAGEQPETPSSLLGAVADGEAPKALRAAPPGLEASSVSASASGCPASWSSSKVEVGAPRLDPPPGFEGFETSAQKEDSHYANKDSYRKEASSQQHWRAQSDYNNVSSWTGNKWEYSKNDWWSSDWKTSWKGSSGGAGSATDWKDWKDQSYHKDGSAWDSSAASRWSSSTWSAKDEDGRFQSKPSYSHDADPQNDRGDAGSASNKARNFSAAHISRIQKILDQPAKGASVGAQKPMQLAHSQQEPVAEEVPSHSPLEASSAAAAEDAPLEASPEESREEALGSSADSLHSSETDGASENRPEEEQAEMVSPEVLPQMSFQ
mmetsp:Transcript_64565/g.154253  ORF Transcript_64565/g.154253 Transcript_64565/m.154253 type:complete len:388 (-) Transcript_64565:474-1637(-)